MAITAIDYALWRGMKQSGVLPERPDVLELGEANWYGDVGLPQLALDIRTFVKDQDVATELLRELTDCARGQTVWLFQVARTFYRTFLGYRSKVAIDLNGTGLALQFDLNEPLPIANLFDIVINTGTAEHVFDQRQFFQTAHERCRPGGFMMHNFPLTGWFDHGFYSHGPTFVADLAAANGYGIACWLLGSLEPAWCQQVDSLEEIHALQRDGKIPANSLQYVLFQKAAEETPFRVPQQGYYFSTLSQSSLTDWEKMR